MDATSQFFLLRHGRRSTGQLARRHPNRFDGQHAEGDVRRREHDEDDECVDRFR